MSCTLKMESSSHVWGMAEYHVQGCVARLHRKSFLGLCGSKLCVVSRGTPVPPTQTLLLKEIRTSPTLKLNQRL